MLAIEHELITSVKDQHTDVPYRIGNNSFQDQRSPSGIVKSASNVGDHVQTTLQILHFHQNLVRWRVHLSNKIQNRKATVVVYDLLMFLESPGRCTNYGLHGWQTKCAQT